jgi:hypothetical protein
MESSFGQLPTPMSSHLFHDVGIKTGATVSQSKNADFPARLWPRGT